MGKYFFLFAIGLLSYQASWAQDRRVIDSLIAELPKVKEDTGKVSLLNELSVSFVGINTGEGLKYGQQALALAENLKWGKGIATAKERIGRNYWRNGNFDEALSNHFQALEFWQKLGDKSRIAAVHSQIGQDYADAGKYPDALEHLSLALAGYEEVADKHGQRFAHSILSWVYNKMGMQPERLKHQYASRRFSEELGYREGLSNSASELAHMLEQQGNYEEALTTYEQSLRVMLEIGNFTNASDNYLNIGRCHSNLGNQAEALKNYQLALELGKKLSHRNNVGDAYVAIGDLHMNQGKRSEALTNFELAIDEFISSNNKQALAELYTRIGACHTRLKNYGAARRYLDKAQALSEELKSISVANKYYEGMVKLDSATGNWKAAFDHYKNFVSTRDSMYNVENAKKIVQAQMQYEFNKKEAAIKADQDKKDALAEQELRRQKVIRNSSMGGFTIMLLFAGIFFVQRNKIKKGSKALEAAKARAEASEAFKSRFLASMSHEIRTPLHGISGYTDLLLETSLTEKQRRYLTSVSHSNERLTEVVNDILDISKLEAGEVKLRHVLFSPARIAEDVQDALSVRAENKGIEFNVHIGEGVPAAVLGDPTRLYQILMNLAGNAVKFTSVGGVQLSVAGCPLSVAGCLQFTVQDTGIGIPADKLDRIFDSFQQAGEDTTARFGGTGLGLTIARELVQLHGSDIRVESEPGKGSTFSFTLMLPLADAAGLEQTEGPAGELYFTQPLKILLADDNAFNREIATEALLRHFEDAEIVEAVNGKGVVEMLGATNPEFDLVLMDMQMPEMNGLEAARHIRQQFPEGIRDIPIIALTASATHEEIEEALATGMNRHLAKPFKPHQLALVIADTLGLSRSAAGEVSGFHNVESSADGPLLPLPASLAAPYDLAYLSDFCDGDEEQVRRFVQKFEAQCPLEIEKLEAAFQQQDRQAIYLAAHSFKPQLEFIGLHEAASIAASLENEARQGVDMDEVGRWLSALKNALSFQA